MADSRAIGVFDSGLGGLTVVREIIRRMPNENIIYFGDTGRVPYGNKSIETIKRYAKEDEFFLLSKGVKLIVAACGTVSSVANEDSKLLPVPFFEMVTHAAGEAVSKTRNGKIGVIGTNATILSDAHKNEILKLNSSAQVVTVSCPLFVPLVEEGLFSEEDIVVIETVRRYLKPIISAGCDTLILGCTHYPVLQNAIRRVIGDTITLINPGVAVANRISLFLNEKGMQNSENIIGEHSFYVSDKPSSFKALAEILIGREIDEQKVKKVDLNSL